METLVRVSRWVGLASCLGYVAARNLFPSEDASMGTGIFFLPLAYLAGLMFVVERIADVRGPRLGAYAWCWTVLLLCWGVSAGMASYRYPAEIVAWEWLGVACVCLYARQVAAGIGPGIFGMMVVALGLSHASIGLYQTTVYFPELREAYENDDPGMHKSMRQIGVEEGSALATSFRNRLYSLEPYGATGHPNTLAGFLLLSLPLSIGWAMSALRQKQASFVSIAILLSSVLIQLYVLIMSKSRSAWVALVVALLVWWWLRRRSAVSWRFPLAVAGVAALVAILAGLLYSRGTLDALVLTESMKSLSYRTEWWQGTMQVIAEHPLWGVGAGSFRDYYLAHKLPFSSEEIADPHNWILEVWATGGLLTLLAYAACLVVGVRSAFALRPVEVASQDRSTPSPRGVLLVSGVLAGVLLIAFGTGLPSLFNFSQYPEVPAWLASLLVTAWAARRDHAWRGEDVRRAIVVGVIALHVHELAAGGVSFFALTSAAWMLLGAASHEPLDPYAPRFMTSALLAGLAAALMLTFVFMQMVPAAQRDRIDLNVRRMEDEIAREQEGMRGESVPRETWSDLARRVDAWVSESRRYAEVIPGDHDAWERLAVAQTTRMRLAARQANEVEREAYRLAVRAWEESIALSPQRFESHRQLAKLYLESAASGLEPGAMRNALDSLQEVILRYPHSAILRWEMGDIFSKMNRKEDAKREFARALELDKTPHEDKRLSVNQRRIAEQYVKQQ